MPVQLGIIVKEAMKILRPSLPSTIEIKTDVLSKRAVLADPTQMHQVLMNLCTNAAHAMQDEGGDSGGKIDRSYAWDRIHCLRGTLQPGRYVELLSRITDMGSTRPLSIRFSTLFSPPKDQGKGPDLVCRSFMEL